MATTKHQIGTAWTELTEAGTDKDFILQHASASGILQARFADTTPTGDEDAHPLQPDGHPLIRAGAAGKLFVRAVGLGYDSNAIITAIISAGV